MGQVKDTVNRKKSTGMKRAGKLAILFAGLALGASADSTISVDSVVQRWPWNNKVDITYTVSGGQNVAAGVFARIVFTAHIGTSNIVIDGVHDIGADASDGTHTVTWTLPPGLRARDCTMTAQLISADNPSGNDYMVIDLATGAITWEGLLATQGDSNSRYNTATYKTDKMVLRKVPAGGTYPTGDDVNYSSTNPRRDWTTDRDYYIGVFPVTQYQYEIIGADSTYGGSTPSHASHKSAVAGNEVAHRPVDKMSWNDLRISTTASTSSIPATASASSGTFFQRLNCKTGRYFDLPTELMFEIAQRAGATTVYPWGDDTDDLPNYAICYENSGNITMAVGTVLPNAWGLYDTTGNVFEWCRDVDGGSIANATDPFTPYWATYTSRRLHGGSGYGSRQSNAYFRASYRPQMQADTHVENVGFRVSMVVD